MNQTKVIIIGAGAAGLMAARVLKEQGIDFIILESTHRLGGRAQTLKSTPHIEYGPEYLHGETPLTDKLIERFGLTTYDVKFDYHLFKDGELKPTPDFWDRLTHVMEDIDLKNDISFADYLQKYDQNSKVDQDMARVFVEGFDAADLDTISSKELHDMKEQVADPKIRKLRRLLNGYGELIENMAQDLLPRIYFSHIVEEIIWERNKVIVRGAIKEEDIPFEFVGERVINTVSIGVLRNLFIGPMPDLLTHFLDQVEMGQVVKMIGEFHPAFFYAFEDHSFPFVAAPDLNYSAWWSSSPLHLPIVTAWCGGARARKLTKMTEDQRKEIYIQELAKISSLSPEEVRCQIINIHHHSWDEDPSFLGAYSYPRVNYRRMTEMVTNFEDTLYFAGEAFHENMSGTVEGALTSGKKVAEAIADDIQMRSDLSLSGFL
ncbi:flavin monoamine oxidase family protein [Peredibacter sp. HCB2-198]|uniref:flavin monoamine oxidase family protein n=1 Tax=Peredibacter sp. HCB2-198 TaxID=3383025 RepID=UPI0038B5E2CF